MDIYPQIDIVFDLQIYCNICIQPPHFIMEYVLYCVQNVLFDHLYICLWLQCRIQHRGKTIYQVDLCNNLNVFLRVYMTSSKDMLVFCHQWNR